jgi:uncharacterized protein YybS (DUF2232 family)
MGIYLKLFCFPGEMIKGIIHGVLITSLIFVVSAYLPIVGVFGALFIPLPTLFYRSKLGRSSAAIIPVLSFMVMVAVSGRISIDMLFPAELLLLGFVLGELIELSLPIEKTFLYTCGSVVLTGITALLIFNLASGKGFWTQMSQYVDQNLQMAMVLYQKTGMSAENIQLISSSLDKIQYVLVRILPALMISSILFIIWTSLLLAKPLLRNRRLFYPDYGPLKLWQAPEALVWGVIGCGLILLFPDNTAKMIGLNGLLILLTVYFFQGIAIVSYYFEKKALPRMPRFFLYSLIGLQQIPLLVVIGLGFFDMWLNFRKLKKPKIRADFNPPEL